jgi:hypothetical protein
VTEVRLLYVSAHARYATAQCSGSETWPPSVDPIGPALDIKGLECLLYTLTVTQLQSGIWTMQESGSQQFGSMEVPPHDVQFLRDLAVAQQSGRASASRSEAMLAASIPHNNGICSVQVALSYRTPAMHVTCTST